MPRPSQANVLETLSLNGREVYTRRTSVRRTMVGAELALNTVAGYNRIGVGFVQHIKSRLYPIRCLGRRAMATGYEAHGGRGTVMKIELGGNLLFTGSAHRSACA